MKQARGFTLVELITVMVIIGILAVYATTSFNRADYSREEYARELITALRYAQEMSMSSTGLAPFEVVISASGFTVQQAGPIPIADPATGAVPYTAAWADATVAPAGATIIFNGRGAPSFGGAPGFSGAIIITVGGVAKTVTVAANTGYAY